MTDQNSGPKADRLNFAEIREGVARTLGGGKPEPKRKRGYHRALKRGEHWAVMRKMTVEMINRMNKQMFEDQWNQCAEAWGLNMSFHSGPPEGEK